ncbi:MAG TPA: hypothetical protein VFM86_01370, partial [Pedococcus sp.]|nr:hypothetical protein [Pedococcus sp.]
MPVRFVGDGRSVAEVVGAVEEVGTRVPVGEPVVVVRGGVVVVVVVLEVVELDVPPVEGVV